jgi:hypothetical protein
LTDPAVVVGVRDQKTTIAVAAAVAAQNIREAAPMPA